MASFCAQLCLRGMGPLYSKTVSGTRQYYIQVQQWIKVTRLPTKVSNGLLIRENHTTATALTRLSWKQQICFYSDSTSKSLTTEAKEGNYTDELSRTDVAHKTQLLPTRDAAPVTEHHISLEDLDAVAQPSALEEISDEEAVSISVPSGIPPASTTLRDYVDKSETLTKLVQLGVNLWKLEQRPNVGSMLLRLNFNADVAPRLLFLKDIGVEDSRFGYIISHNPFILTESLENLQSRWLMEDAQWKQLELWCMPLHHRAAAHMVAPHHCPCLSDLLHLILKVKSELMTYHFDTVEEIQHALDAHKFKGSEVNYLKSKKFSLETVASMVSRAPYLLNFSVKRLDNRLGFYQQQLSLSTSNTRDIVARLPRLLCGSLEPVKENLKVCEIELGFKRNEIQDIVLAVPKVLTANKRKLTEIFDFIHNTMKVPHHLISKFPQVFNCKYLRLRERHLFLEYLGKAQYDPTLPNYISLDRFVSLPDETFCTELALATLEDFYLFLKTL